MGAAESAEARVAGGGTARRASRVWVPVRADVQATVEMLVAHVEREGPSAAAALAALLARPDAAPAPTPPGPSATGTGAGPRGGWAEEDRVPIEVVVVEEPGGGHGGAPPTATGAVTLPDVPAGKAPDLRRRSSGGYGGYGGDYGGGCGITSIPGRGPADAEERDADAHKHKQTTAPRRPLQCCGTALLRLAISAWLFLSIILVINHLIAA